LFYGKARAQKIQWTHPFFGTKNAVSSGFFRFFRLKTAKINFFIPNFAVPPRKTANIARRGVLLKFPPGSP
jgi:hypothetical protein